MMRKTVQVVVRTERKWLMPLLASSFVSILLFAFAASTARTKRPRSPLRPIFESRAPHGGVPAPPRFAYLISGSDGDGERIKRLLGALYHPRNQYLLHLDRDASDAQREHLGYYVESVPVFYAARNVHVVGNADVVVPAGPTSLASVLHGAALLLRLRRDWDWFISISASDYPLIRQDDLLHVFSYLPKDLNFVAHTRDMGWKEYYRVNPIIIDPGLSMATDRQLFYATQRRVVPTAFKLFTGSSFFVLSRSFMEYCILGWDSLPRKVLMYSANLLSSQQTYFQTVLCNAREFKNTTVNSDLCYVVANNTSHHQELSYLNISHYVKMTQSGAAFARNFQKDDSILDKIDKQILHRTAEKMAPGGWCIGSFQENKDPCSVWGDIGILRTSRRAQTFEKFILGLISNGTFRSNQCKIQ